MEDNSDDGNLPEQSYFKNKNYVEKEQMSENYVSNDNENYNDNFENQYPSNNENYDYENYNDQEYNDNYNENYNDDDNYQENLDNENYIDNENTNYSNSYSSYNYANNEGNYKNYPNYNYSNKNKNKNYKYNYYNHQYQKYNLTKSKESYLTTFNTNFKLWLMLVIKLNSEQGKETKISENKSVNKEIIESFLKNYEIELNNKKGKENENNVLYISIKNTKLKNVVDKIYIVEFSIIIEDKIKLFCVNKYIEIFVKGEIYFEKYPKFIFQVKDYKLTLDLEKDKNYKNNDNIIEIPKLEKEFQTCEIGMSPDNCIINNKEFKKIYIDINGDENIKDPQREIRDCLDSLMRENWQNQF